MVVKVSDVYSSVCSGRRHVTVMMPFTYLTVINDVGKGESLTEVLYVIFSD